MTELQVEARRIFEQAVAMSIPSRDGFVQGACAGDTALLSAVQAMLAEHDVQLTLATLGGDGEFVGGLSGDSATEGQLAAAGYSALSLVARGGMGEVWRGRNSAGELVALKLVHPSMVGDRAAAERFAREARIGMALRHPNVVRTRAVTPLERRGGVVPMIVMDFVEGEPLSDVAGRTWAADELREVALDVTRGLCAIHAAGFVHRDIKPANLHLGVDGRTRVLDLGIARRGDAQDRLTRTGQLIGTLVYAAPEQLLGRPNTVDARADLYALGVVLREMLTGAPVHGGISTPELLARKWNPLPPLELPEQPGWLVALVEALTQPQPEARPSSAVDVLACLEHRRRPRELTEDHHPSQLGEAVVRTLVWSALVDGDEEGDRRAARDLLAKHGGREIGRFDGTLCMFRSAAAAVRFAVAYHGVMRTSSAEPRLARVAVHTGSVQLSVSTHADVALGVSLIEVAGGARALVAQVGALAQPGQTLATDAALAALDGPVDEVAVARHGFYQLEGVEEPVQVAEVAVASAGPQGPPQDTVRAFRVVQVGAGWSPAREIPNNLPASSDRFIGRRHELRALSDLFDGDARLVTLVGAAGIGKSRLAVHYGARWLGRWPGGVWVCTLAEARSAEDLLHALGRDLDVPLEGDATATLGEALNNRRRSLVVLDTFEHLAGEVEVVRALRRHAPEVRWLVTSRQRLGEPDEQVVRIAPLGAGTAELDLHAVAEAPAVALFLDRARQARPDFRLSADNVGDVVRLVDLLDGLPLAIELAAARARVLTPKALLKRLGRRLDLLRGQGPARRATLRGALDWSWELLEDAERAGLATCAVFEGGFDLEAVEAVVGQADPASWPMDTIESLVEKSLVRSVPDGSGEIRFTLLGAVRDHALEKLQALGLGEVARNAHAEHYAACGHEDALASLYGQDAHHARGRLRADLGNVAAAVEFAAGEGAGELAATAAIAALTLLATVGPLPMAERLGALARGAGPEGAVAVQLDLALGVARNRAGELTAAAEVLQMARTAAQELGRADLQAAALHELGHGLLLQRQAELAREHLIDAIALAEGARALRVQAAGLAELAHLDGIRGGAYEEPLSQLERARQLQRQAGDVSGEALTESYLGALHCTHGHFGPGRRAYEESRRLAAALGDRRTVGLAEGMLAGICVLTDHLDEARAHFETALATQREIGDQVYEAVHATNYGYLLERLDEFDEAIHWLERAIHIASTMGDVMTEGGALATLGAVRARSGRPHRALKDLERGEELLRGAGDPAELGKLLCRKGSVMLDVEDQRGAEAAAVEASAIVEDLGLTEDAELPSMVRALQHALAG